MTRTEVLAELHLLTGLSITRASRGPAPSPREFDEWGKPQQMSWYIGLPGRAIQLPSSDSIRRPALFRSWRGREALRDGCTGQLPELDAAICSRILKLLFQLSEMQESNGT